MRGDRSDESSRRKLREKAKRRVRSKGRAVKTAPKNKALDLIHELEVHQEELELQNQELRRSQAELEESRRKYFELYDLAPVGYVTLDRNSAIREINLTGAELLGKARARLKGKRFTAFVERSARDEFSKFCRRLFASAKREELELKIDRGKTSLTILLSGVVLPDSAGRLNHCHLSMTDITALKTAESWLSRLIEATQDAVISIDGKAQIALFNYAAEQIFGYAAEEVIGKKVNMLMSEPYASEHNGYIARYERTGEKRAIGKIRELSARRKNGEIFPIELSVTEVDGNPDMRYVAFIRDISEKAQLQAQVVERARLAVLNDTATMVAHEIANPLHGMSMSIQLLERRLAEIADQSVMATLKRISTDVSRLKNLLYDFRTVSMQESYDLRPIALESVIEELCASEKVKLESMGIRVELALQPKLPDIFADRAKIKQVLLNLCKNAEEAMPEGGTLTLRGYESDGKVMVEVRDTGIGLPENFSFEGSFKTTKPTGTGLGLVIVRQIVSRHHGSVTYTREPEMGTTFTLGFPIHSVAAARIGEAVRI